MFPISIYGLTILVALVAGSLLEALACFFNRRAWRSPQDDPIMAYARAKAALDLVASTSKLVALGIWWLAGGFPWLDRLVATWHLGRLGSGVVYVGILLVAFKLFSQPFKVYHTFVLEARFGLNATPWVTFVTDRAKGFLLSLVLGGPFLISVLYFFSRKGEWAWLYFWASASLCVVFIQYLAPVWLMPFFSRFRPLPEGTTSQAIRAHLQRVGLDCAGIFLMDGAGRATRASVFVTGWGRKRRVVLFDTLLQRHSDAEVVALLAHEVGHHRLGLLWRVTGIAVVQIGLLSALLAVAMDQPELHRDFFMERLTLHGGFIFFILLAVPLDLLTSPLLKAISRRHVHAADRFALETLAAPESLAAALRRVAEQEPNRIPPAPWQVFLHETQPPLLWRIEAIERWRIVGKDAIQPASDPDAAGGRVG
ncbi:MAG: M48 family metallopeptidase [Magnetococcales bacterium]|nr:M48 family metallopeptidase [Magnetococcales bacterium]